MNEMRGLVGVSAMLLVVFAIWSCQPVPRASEPVPGAGANPEVSQTKGETLYLRHCAVCHGPTGKGDGLVLLNPTPADLSSAKVQTQLAPQLMRTVHEGRSNTAMGAWSHALSDQEIEEVVTHLRTFRH